MQIWADSGVKGLGFIHAPKTDKPIATVDTFGASVGYFAVTTTDIASGCAARGAAKTPCALADSARARLGTLEGKTFRSRESLYDALHAMGYLVVATYSGGTYYLVRGDMPERAGIEGDHDGDA